MNMERRYCQNRVRKRKKNMDCFLSEQTENTVEDERLFKLSRFVKDVNKFVEEKENSSNRNNMCKEAAPTITQKNVKKTKPSKQSGKKGLFQNGIKTRFYSRGPWGKEKTARLEEDLQQIIGLSNKENECHCPHHCQPSALQPTSVCPVRPERKPLQPLFESIKRQRSECDRTSPNSTHLKGLPSPQSVGEEAISDTYESPQDLDELDNKLYPEFARIITISSTESKSIHFKKESYVTNVKKKLLDIYLQGKKENTQELSCSVSDLQRSSVATSTSPQGNLSPPTEPDLAARSTSSPFSCSEQPFSAKNFVTNWKSNIEFMEETIGPGSSCTNTHQSPVLEERLHPVSSPPLVTHRRSRDFCMDGMREPKYYDHPLRYQFSQISPIPNFRSIVNDGVRDHHHFDRVNSFLPPIDEESPEFQYFTRPMF